MTNYLCTHCNINWAILAVQDDNNYDEMYEFCPTCKSDMHLIENANHPAFVQCQITGRIYNPFTGEDYNPLKEMCTIAPDREFNIDAWREKKEEHRMKEEQRIDKYIAESETIGKEKARQNYLNV